MVQYWKSLGIGLMGMWLGAVSLQSQMFEFDWDQDAYTPLTGGTELTFEANKDPNPVVLDRAIQFNGDVFEYFQVVEGRLILLDPQTFVNLKLYPSDDFLASVPGETRFFYRIDGEYPQRVLRVECQKMFFKEEFKETGSYTSYITFSIAVSEGQGGIRYHYGPSSIVNFDLCFRPNNGMLVGWWDNKDVIRELNGSPDQPQPVVLPNMQAPHPRLNAYPIAGRVFSWGDDRTGIRYQVFNDLHVFPTATKAWVTVQDKRIKDLSPRVKLFDNQGRLVKILSMNEQNQVDLSGFAAGYYQLILQSGNKRYIAKVIKL
jgi:hypothetical protein